MAHGTRIRNAAIRIAVRQELRKRKDIDDEKINELAKDLTDDLIEDAVASQKAGAIDWKALIKMIIEIIMGLFLSKQGDN